MPAVRAQIVKTPPDALVEVGNIDLSNRPKVTNPDGSVSTVRSIGIQDGRTHVVIPTVSPDGKIWTNQQAVANYQKTGQHLGKFTDQETADNFAQALHHSEGLRLVLKQPSLSASDIAEVARQMAGVPASSGTGPGTANDMTIK